MSTHSESLENVLQEQLRLYEQYLDLLTRDGDLMAHLKIEELEHNNKMKTTVFLKLQTMDEARKNAVRQLATEVGITEDRITLEVLARRLSAFQSSRLLELRKKLKSVIERARSLQVNTSALAQTSLTWINGSMRALQGLMATSPVYSAQGKVQNEQAFTGRSVEKRV